MWHQSTVKPVYNGHPWDPPKMAIVGDFQSKLLLKLVWLELFWWLLTGGRYSEVAVNTGLTVYEFVLQIWLNLLVNEPLIL